MGRRKTLCKTFEVGESAFDNDLTAGGYLAAVFRDALPRAVRSEDRIVRHGYGVGFGPDGHHPWSSNWHPPTGYITAFNNGQPAKTKKRSLPL